MVLRVFRTSCCLSDLVATGALGNNRPRKAHLMRNSVLAHALSFLPVAAALALAVYYVVSLSAAALTVAVQVAKHGPNAPVQVAAPAPAAAPKWFAVSEQSSTIEN